jgi:predicted dehydrogenase
MHATSISFKPVAAPVRWGIIGCGDVCELKSGPAFYKAEGSLLAAVMRRDAAKAEDFARRHHVARWYTDADALIADPGVDAVYIATPPSSHAAYAIGAMRAGKPVYVEKPMATAYVECEEMNRVSHETGIPLLVAYYRRSLPYFLKIKEILDSGEIGKTIAVNTRFHAPAHPTDGDAQKQPWRVRPEIAGAGYFYDMACHTLDILDFLLGEITVACGQSTNRAGLYAAEDTVTASFRFASGAVGCGQWAYAAPAVAGCDEVEITGSGGSVWFATFSFAPILVQTAHSQAAYSFPRPQHIQQPMIENVIAQLCGREKSPSDGISAARTNRVMDQILNAQGT